MRHDLITFWPFTAHSKPVYVSAAKAHQLLIPFALAWAHKGNSKTLGQPPLACHHSGGKGTEEHQGNLYALPTPVPKEQMLS